MVTLTYKLVRQQLDSLHDLSKRSYGFDAGFSKTSDTTEPSIPVLESLEHRFEGLVPFEGFWLRSESPLKVSISKT